MTANTEYLLDLYSDQLDQDVLEGLEAIDQGTGRLQALVNDLLDFSRMESGRLKMTFGPVYLGSVIDQAEQEMRSAIEEKGIQFVREGTSEALSVRGDYDRLVQVFVNLLDNAAKFTPSGGTITVGVDLEEDGHVRAAVADTGIGIPPDHQEKVFDRFYQVDGSSTREYGGAGLGLSIVKTIMDGHGGRIWVESPPGKGATFVLTLPVWEEEP